jgi:hypothetical protein
LDLIRQRKRTVDAAILPDGAKSDAMLENIQEQ